MSVPTIKRKFGPHPDDPHANQLDKVGGRGRVLRVWQTAYLSSVGKHIQFMQFGKAGLRPLIWLNSIDYPMSAPWGFCVDASDAGFNVISVRRPGFGESSPAESIDEELNILSAFLSEGQIENAVLIVEGTSRPAGLRLALEDPRITYTLLVRPGYVAESFGDVDPWLRDLILQTMKTRAGASFSLGALAQIGRRAGHTWLYENFLKVESDTHFVRSNARDISEAWECLCALKAETFRRELRSLEPDPTLVPGYLEGLRGLAVIGADTPAVWRDGFLRKSEGLGIQTAFLPDGSLFAAYRNGDALLEIITERA